LPSWRDCELLFIVERTIAGVNDLQFDTRSFCLIKAIEIEMPKPCEKKNPKSQFQRGRSAASLQKRVAITADWQALS